MSNVKILIVMPEFGLAGAETMCESLVNELYNIPQVEIIVSSLYTFHSPITERMESKGIKILYLGKKKGLDLGVIRKLCRIIDEYDINVVHTHRYVMQYAVPAAIIKGVKTKVHTVHSIASKELPPLQRKLAKLFYKFFSVIPVAISPIVRNTINEEYGIPVKKIPMIYNGSDLSRCLRKETYNIENKTLQMIHVGRYIDIKNQDLIIKTIYNLKIKGVNVYCRFIGGGDKEYFYKELAHKLGVEDCCEFMGLQSNVYPFLNKSDLFLLPSKYEGMPISLIEGMGTGLPIIASNVGGIPDMINHMENGILINPNEVELYDAILKLYNDPALRERLGIKAREKSIEFSSKNMAENYLKIYRNGRE